MRLSRRNVTLMTTWCFFFSFVFSLLTIEPVESVEMEARFNTGVNEYPSTPVVGDINADGHPEIIFSSAVSNGNTPSTQGHLWVIRKYEDNTIETVWSKDDLGAPYSPAIGDINNDGVPEIVVYVWDGTGRVFAVEPDGSVLWSTPVNGAPHYAYWSNHAPTLGDVNGDSYPDVAVTVGSYLKVLSGVDGTLLWSRPGGSYAYGKVAILDLDQDGNNEVLSAQGTLYVYRKDGTLWWSGSGRDLAVADLDGNGTPEVIATYSGFRVYSFDGTLQWNRSFSTAGSGAAVADFDLDGLPEIAVGLRSGYVYAYNGDGSLLWSTGYLAVGEWDNPDLTTTDLNGDGSPEVTVISDDKAVLVIDGQTGIVLVNTNISIDENEHSPVIADVDNDGHAEIVVPSGSGYGSGGAVYWRNLLIFGDDDNWVETRMIWNQMAYYATNIQGDLSIGSDYTPWITYNTWRTQLPGFIILDQPDLVVAPSDIIFSLETPMEGDIATIEANIRNIGSVAAQNVVVRFFDGDPDSGGTQIGTDQAIANIPITESGVCQVLWNTTGKLGSHSIYVLVDPENVIKESGETNNQASREILVLTKPDLAISGDNIEFSPASPVQAGVQVQITALVENQGETAAVGDVSFYWDVKETAYLIETLAGLSFAGSSMIAVQSDWDTTGLLTEGVHTVFAVISNVMPLESDINNNEAFKTLQVIIPPGQPQNLQASATVGSDIRNINLQWTAPGDDDDIGTVSSYLAKLSTSDIATEGQWDAAKALTTSWTSLRPAGETENRTAISSSALTPSGTYYVALRAVDAAGTLGPFTSAPVNMPPTATNVAIAPSDPPTAETTDNLVLTYTYSDPEADPESGTLIKWYKGGVHQPAYNNQSTLPSSATKKGETWKASVQPANAKGMGLEVESNSLTILNIPPVANPNGPYSSKIDTSGNTVLPITFNGTGSSDADGDPLAYAWTFGDGGTGTGPTPTHTYPAILVLYPRTFTVTLKVYDGEAYSSTVNTTATVTINQKPVADVGGPYGGIAGEPLQFDGSASSDPDSDPITYVWDFGDGRTGTGVSPQNIYDSYGSYTAALIVSDPMEDSDPDTVSVLVKARPVADFTWDPPTPDEGTQVDFTDASTDADGMVVAWSWDFDVSDGIQEDSNLQNPSHTYMDDGVYTVTLAVTDNDGSYNTTSANITVTPITVVDLPPVVSAFPVIMFYSSESYSLNLDEYVSDPDDPDDALIWTVGDNAYVSISIDLATREAEFTSKNTNWGGNTVVTFTATDPMGLSDQVEVDVIIVDSVSPQFADIIAVPYALTDTSVGMIISWKSDEPASSQVEYGIDTSYGCSTPVDSDLVTDHEVLVLGLPHFTEYHFRAESYDGSGNESISGDYSILTTGPYHVTVGTDQTVYSSGTPVDISGSVEHENGTPVSDCHVKISVEVHDFSRSAIVTTGPDGSYSYIFTPIEAEAGTYAVTASVDRYGMVRSAQTSFSVLGMKIIPNWLSIDMGAGTSETRTINIKNIGQTTLTGISIQENIPDLPAEVNVTIDSSSTATSLGAGESTSFDVIVSTSPDVNLYGSFDIVVGTDQGYSETVSFNVTISSMPPTARVSPSTFNISVYPGDSVQQTLTISNIGYGSLSAIDASVDLPWAQIIMGDVQDLEHNESESISVLFFPPSNTPVDIYPGNVTLSTSASESKIPFHVAVSQSETADVFFRVTNDFGELVPEAHIALTPRFPGGDIQSGITDLQGELVIPDLHVGRYTCEVNAQKHDAWQGTIEVQPGSGLAQEIPIFLFTSALSYEWEVVPTIIPDRYFIQLNYTFETDIPKPALVSIPPRLDLPFSGQFAAAQGHFTIYNGSLINVNNIRITVPDERMNLQFIMSLDRSFSDLSVNDRNIIYTGATIPPQSALTVYYIVTLKNEHPSDYYLNHFLFKPFLLIEGDYIHFDPVTKNPITSQTRLKIPISVRFAGHLEVRPPFISLLRISDIAIVAKFVAMGYIVGGQIGGDYVLVSPTVPAVSIANRSADQVTLHNTAYGIALSVSAGLGIGIKWESEDFPEIDLPVGVSIWTSSIDPTELNGNEVAYITETGSADFGNPGVYAEIGVKILDLDVQAGLMAFIYRYGTSRPRLGTIPIWITSITVAGISIIDPGPGGDGDDDDVVSDNGGWIWRPDPDDWEIPDPIPVDGNGGPSTPPEVDLIHEIVKFQIDQEAVLERQGFKASLGMANMLSTKDIVDVGVMIDIRDDNGADVSSSFAMGITDLAGIDSVDGQGVLHPNTPARAVWTLIPDAGAGGISSEGRKYYINAAISYKVDGQEFIVETSARTVVVYPQPQFRLDYFLPREVTANDPFRLAVVVTNQGPGTVSKFSVDSMQPRIVENLSGLLINMSITGTCVNGVQSGSTKLTFNDIEAGQSVIGYWAIRSSLSGQITEFDASWSHGDYQSIALDPLIKEIHAHIIEHDYIRIPLTGNTALIDEDNDGIPDYLMSLDDMSKLDVNPVTSNVTKTATADDPNTDIVVPKVASGWIYTSLPDMLPLHPISKIVRIFDGIELDPNNYWRDGSDVHFVDDPDIEYTIVYELEPELVETNVTSMIDVQKFNMRYNRRRDQLSLDVTIANVSDEVLNSPVKLIIKNISVSDVNVANADGTNNDGDVYFDYSDMIGTDEQLSPGETSSARRIVFINPQRRRFSFDIIVTAAISSNGQAAPDLAADNDSVITMTIPGESILLQNYPNPFNPDTWIPYELAEPADVIIKIYDVGGRLVRTLDLGYKELDVYTSKEKAAYWDGRNEVGESVTSGVYFYQIKAGDLVSTKKSVMLK